MENFLFALNTVLPFLLYIAFGYGVRMSGLADEDFMKRLNKVIFQAFFPILMFNNLYSIPEGMTLNLRLVAVAIISVLLVLLGQGTKIASHLLADGGKVYSGQLRLGLTTDTWDIQGEVLTESPWQQVTEADVRAEVAHWLTLHEQEVPAYSAAKHEGQSLYKLARKGKEVPKKVKSMEISQADVLEVELPFVRFRVACSSGTYIRSLAHSLGIRLGCGAMLTELTREYSHPFGLEVACGLDELSADPGLLVKHLRPLAEALPHWPVLELDEAAEARIRNGMAIPCRDDVGDKALLQRQGMPLALARRSETPQGPCWTVLRGLWN